MGLLVFILSLVFATLISEVSLTGPLKGNVCVYNEMKKDTMQASRQKSYKYYYSSKCHFWNWGRCKKEATGYSTEYYIKPIVKQVVVRRCCAGWKADDSGRCNIHNKYPDVFDCVTPQSLQRDKTTDKVTWKEPSFREAKNHALTISKPPITSPGALNWGQNTLIYSATSTNNQLSSSCTLTINVQPNPARASITGYKQNETLVVGINDETNLTCVAFYGKKTGRLSWYLDGIPVSQGLSDTAVESDYADHWHHTSVFSYQATARGNPTLSCVFSDTPNDEYQINIDVRYEIAPVVLFCPSGQVKITPHMKTYISWKAPEFEDPRWNEPIDVTSSLGNTANSKEFSWGTYPIEYTGTNARNGLSAKCKFIIIVKPPDCKTESIMPTKGALLCGSWDEHYVQACMPVCSPQVRNTDTLWIGEFSEISICGANGLWSPLKKLDCEAAVKKTQNTPANPSNFIGTCDRATINQSVKSKFIDYMLKSAYNLMCGRIDSHVGLKLDIVCPKQKS